MCHNEREAVCTVDIWNLMSVFLSHHLKMTVVLLKITDRFHLHNIK